MIGAYDICCNLSARQIVRNKTVEILMRGLMRVTGGKHTGNVFRAMVCKPRGLRPGTVENKALRRRRKCGLIEGWWE